MAENYSDLNSLPATITEALNALSLPKPEPERVLNVLTGRMEEPPSPEIREQHARWQRQLAQIGRPIRIADSDQKRLWERQLSLDPEWQSRRAEGSRRRALALVKEGVMGLLSDSSVQRREAIEWLDLLDNR